MIRKLSLAELIDAARDLESAEQLALVAAIGERLRQAGCDAVGLSASRNWTPADEWMDVAFESLSRAYGQLEPEYSEKDLVP
jgi:hypothetical protein